MSAHCHVCGFDLPYEGDCSYCTVLALRDDWADRCYRAEAALSKLVELKDGPRDEAYEREKPLAWQAARDHIDNRAFGGRLPASSASE